MKPAYMKEYKVGLTLGELSQVQKHCEHFPELKKKFYLVEQKALHKHPVFCIPSDIKGGHYRLAWGRLIWLLPWKHRQMKKERREQAVKIWNECNPYFPINPPS